MLPRYLVVPVLTLGSAVAAALPIMQMHHAAPERVVASTEIAPLAVVAAPPAVAPVVVEASPRGDAFGVRTAAAASASRVAVQADGRAAGWVTPDPAAVARHRAAQAAAAAEAARNTATGSGGEVRVVRTRSASSGDTHSDRRGRARAQRVRSITGELRQAMSQRFAQPFDFIQSWQRERREMRRNDRRGR